jgi:hypothetical protein
MGRSNSEAPQAYKVVAFNGHHLIISPASLNSEILVSDWCNLPPDHINIFCDVYDPKGQKWVHSFYAGHAGQAPIEKRKSMV